jgi:hypothetical protein
MPVDKLIERLSEVITAPFLTNAIEILIRFHQIYIPFLGMECDENTTAKHKFSPEEPFNFIPFLVDQIL